MSAPASAYYQNNGPRLKLTASNGATALASWAINVYSETAGMTPLQVKGWLLNTFFLDDWILVTHRDNSGVVHTSFIGFVNDQPTTTNYKMHAAARRFALDTANSVQNRITFLDAGLNTRPFTYFDGDFPTYWANLIIVDFNVNSSYYDDTTAFGFEFRKVGTTNWASNTIATGFPAKKDIAEGYGLISIPEDYFQKGDNVEFRPWAENAEGRFTGDIRTIIVDDNIVKKITSNKGNDPCLDYQFTELECYMKKADYTWLQTFQQSSDGGTGKYLYNEFSSSGSLSPATTGWYDKLIPTEPQRMVYIGSNGEIRKTLECGTKTNVNCSFTRTTDGLNRTFVNIVITLPYSVSQTIYVSARVRKQGTTEVISLSQQPLTAGSTSYTFTEVAQIMGSEKYEFVEVVFAPNLVDNQYLAPDYHSEV